jgi:hypothetical protein
MGPVKHKESFIICAHFVRLNRPEIIGPPSVSFICARIAFSNLPWPVCASAKLPEAHRPWSVSIRTRSCQRKSTEFRTPSTYQPSSLRIIDHFGNRPIPNALNRLVNHIERHQKPLPRLYRLSKTIFDAQVELCCAK